MTSDNTIHISHNDEQDDLDLNLEDNTNNTLHSLVPNSIDLYHSIHSFITYSLHTPSIITYSRFKYNQQQGTSSLSKQTKCLPVRDR